MVLALSDFDQTGLDVEMTALIDAGMSQQSGGVSFWTPAGAPWAVSGTLLDGDVTVSGDEGPLRRFMVTPVATPHVIFRMNGDGSVPFSTYFRTGGGGADLSLYVQTEDDGVASMPIAGAVHSAGAGWINFTMNAAVAALTGAIAASEPVIIALARRAPVEVDLTFAGAVTPAGTIATTKMRRVKLALVGTVAAAGTVARDVRAALAGAVAAAGTVAKDVRADLAGGLAPAGTVAKNARAALAGGLAVAGTAAIAKTRRVTARPSWRADCCGEPRNGEDAAGEARPRWGAGCCGNRCAVGAAESTACAQRPCGARWSAGEADPAIAARSCRELRWRGRGAVEARRWRWLCRGTRGDGVFCRSTRGDGVFCRWKRIRTE